MIAATFHQGLGGTFDKLQYWDVGILKKRADLSPNLQNLLKSGVLDYA